MTDAEEAASLTPPVADTPADVMRGPEHGVNCPGCGVRLPANYDAVCPDCGADGRPDAALSTTPTGDACQHGHSDPMSLCTHCEALSTEFTPTGDPNYRRRGSDATEVVREKLERNLAKIQQGDRPLPWVVHSGCSYRRIASETTRENPRSFPDGNVLHALKQSDGHPDLSMSEDQLNALVEIVNALPSILAALKADKP